MTVIANIVFSTPSSILIHQNSESKNQCLQEECFFLLFFPQILNSEREGSPFRWAIPPITLNKSQSAEINKCLGHPWKKKITQPSQATFKTPACEVSLGQSDPGLHQQQTTPGMHTDPALCPSAFWGVITQNNVHLSQKTSVTTKRNLCPPLSLSKPGWTENSSEAPVQPL